jgi:hypothetical protein
MSNVIGKSGIRLLRLDGNAVTDHGTNRHGIKALANILKTGTCLLIHAHTILLKIHCVALHIRI